MRFGLRWGVLPETLTCEHQSLVHLNQQSWDGLSEHPVSSPFGSFDLPKAIFIALHYLVGSSTLEVWSIRLAVVCFPKASCG
jgi:hypothetical protein